MIFRVYLLLAVASLLAATVWHAAALPALSPSAFPLSFYQRVVGHLDGRNCPSYPVCSLYARQAWEKHGILIGSWLMLDRLIHEADDVRRGPWILDQGRQRLYDPLSRNDFWLQRGVQ